MRDRSPVPLTRIVLACSAVAGCAGWSSSDSTRTFDEVCAIVARDFYDPHHNGVDWHDTAREFRPAASRATSLEELGHVINRMLARLQTSHTHFYTDQDPRYYQLRDIFAPQQDHPYVGIGVLTQRIDNRVFVRAVLHGGPAAAAGLERGDRIVSVDGKPFHSIRSFAGGLGESLRMRVQRHAHRDADLEMTIVPALLEPNELFEQDVRGSARIIEYDGKRIAYIRLLSYAGKPLHDAVVELLDREPLASADALVLDFRDGWGGANSRYLDLFHKRVPEMRLRFRDGTEGGSGRRWRKPVTLLVNESSRSGKEMWAYAFRKYGYGPVVGTRTAGAVVGGRPYPVGDRAVLYLAVTDATVDGERLEGRGVTPDVEVADRLPYCNGADPQLDRAIQVAARTARS